MPSDNMQLYSEAILPLGPTIPPSGSLNTHELLPQPLKLLSRKPYHIGVFEQHPSLARLKRAVFGYPQIKFKSATGLNGVCFDVSPCGAIHLHMKKTQCQFPSLQLPPVSLVAALDPQSLQALAQSQEPSSVMGPTLPLRLSSWRNLAFGIVPHSIWPSQTAQYKARGIQGRHKRKNDVSADDKNSKKGKSGGADGFKHNKGDADGNEGEDDDIFQDDGKKPVKVESIKAKLFNDEKEPYGCPFYWRRPDMYAACRSFRRSGEEIHRLKEHLNYHHRLRCYFCSICFQRFEHANEFNVHTAEESCVTGTRRDYLLGIDEVQWRNLVPRKDGSLLIGSSPKDKWEAIYHIVFPDTEDGGIPDPFQEPEKRDMLRRVRQAMDAESLWTPQLIRFMQLMFDIVDKPEEFNHSWRNAASNNLSIGTRPQGCLSPHTPSVYNPSLSISDSCHPHSAQDARLRDTDSAYASNLGSGYTGGPVSTASEINRHRNFDPQVQVRTESQLSHFSNSHFSPPGYYPTQPVLSSIQPSPIGQDPSQTGITMSLSVSGDHTHFMPANQHEPDISNFARFDSEFVDFDDPRMPVSSGPEDRREMGGQFREPTNLALLATTGVNPMLLISQTGNIANFRAP